MLLFFGLFFSNDREALNGLPPETINSLLAVTLHTYDLLWGLFFMRFFFFLKANGTIFPLSRSAVELFSSLSAIGMLWNGSVFAGVLTLEFAPPLHLCSVCGTNVCTRVLAGKFRLEFDKTECLVSLSCLSRPKRLLNNCDFFKHVLTQ